MASQSMRAIVIEGPNAFYLRDVPKPVAVNDEVLIKVKHVGICGTDLEIISGQMGYYVSGKAKFPVIPGHEWVGEVVDLGPNAKGFQIGDHVVGETHVPCWECLKCGNGNYHHCQTRTETGICNRNGAFAEYIAHPSKSLHKISHSISFQDAALVEPATVAVHNAKLTIRENDYCVIFGDGPIGLLLLQAAKNCFGAKKVVIVGATPHRLKKAVELGADHIIDITQLPKSSEESLKAIRQKLLEFSPKGELPDCALEATGVPQAAQCAVNSVTIGGRVSILGIFSGGSKIELDLNQLVLSDLVLRGAIGSPGNWPEVIKYMEEGKLVAGPLVTHVVPLEKFEEAVKLLKSKADGVIKVVVQVS